MVAFKRVSFPRRHLPIYSKYWLFCSKKLDQSNINLEVEIKIIENPKLLQNDVQVIENPDQTSRYPGITHFLGLEWQKTGNKVQK